MNYCNNHLNQAQQNRFSKWHCQTHCRLYKISKPSTLELKESLDFIKETKDKMQTRTYVHREHRWEEMYFLLAIG